MGEGHSDERDRAVADRLRERRGRCVPGGACFPLNLIRGAYCRRALVGSIVVSLIVVGRNVE